MKKVKIIVSLFVISIALNIQAQSPASKSIKDKVNAEVAPIMTFESVIYDWGTLNEGEKTETDFTFTNTGKTDLIITRIKGSCGCTVPSNWSKEPIKPGEKSSFHVVFNSRNKPNKQQKTITISCNTAKGSERVRIKGMVIPDPEMAKMRAERTAKRKEMYAKRKVERERLELEQSKLSKEKKINEVKRNEKSLEKQRSNSLRVMDEKSEKLDKNLKDAKNVNEKQLKLAEKDQKLAKKQLKVNENKLKEEEKARKQSTKLAEQKLKTEKEANKRAEKELKLAEKQAKENAKAVKKSEKAAKAVKKESEKAAKAAAKKVKRAEKEAKKLAGLKKDYNKALDKFEKEEAKLAKMQNKLKSLELKGKLSPEDIDKRKADMLKQESKINDAKTKMQKVKRKM